MKSKYIKLIFPLILSLFLCSCVSLRVGKVEQNFSKQSAASRQAKLRAIKTFNISGALSITTPQKTYLVNYTWVQNGGYYRIKLASSLNAVSYEIIGGPNKVVLRQAKHKDIMAHNVNALMQRELGYVLPLAGMRYWVLGLPAPGNYKSTLDNFGHLQTLKQNGWFINYLLYQSYDHLDLPRLMRISGHKLAIKFVIKNWQL